MKKRNVKSDGSPRLGRPPGPTPNRGRRPWDEVDTYVIAVVAANPDLERWKIAEALGISGARLSNITCSPEGARRLAELMASQELLSAYRLKRESGIWE
ncbi:MAG TPA: hypothetical protein PLE72_02755 [Azospira sp.]|nr:hypothetical protein [Nitrospira sp.]HNJ75660.1 hypothetical protein [Azospira sp.]